MPGVFVTATGTDVGKTYVTAALIRAGRRAGVAMDALKPILTGYAETEAAASDAGILLEALGEKVTAEGIARVAPFRFAAPLSPNMAAAAENRRLDVAAVTAACRAALRPDRLVLIEGIGGVMVPLDEQRTVLDLIGALALPVVLVTGSQLGALSHCLTAEAVLRASGHPAQLIVVNESAGSTVPLAETRATIAAFCARTPTTIVPRDAGDDVFAALVHQIHAMAAHDDQHGDRSHAQP